MTYTERRVLNWINRVRAEEGRKPLKTLRKGKPCTIDACTIAASLGGYCEVGPYDEPGDTARVFMYGGKSGNFTGWYALPSYVASFARAFDQGRYPHLVKS